MPSLGSESFDLILGMPAVLRHQAESVTRRGEDGFWLTKIGKKSQPVSVTCIVGVANAAAAKTKLDTTYPALLAAATGALVTVTDDQARTWTNVALLDFERVEEKDSPVQSGFTDVYILTTRWTIQVMQ